VGGGGKPILGSTPFGVGGRAGDPLRGWAEADIAVAAIDIAIPTARCVRPAMSTPRRACAPRPRSLPAAMSCCIGSRHPRPPLRPVGRRGGRIAASARAECWSSSIVANCDCFARAHSRLSRTRLHGRHHRLEVFRRAAVFRRLAAAAAIMRRIASLALPAGLADYSSRLDWPADLRAKAELQWANEANLGLGLRWVAALDETERFLRPARRLAREVLIVFEAIRQKTIPHVGGIHVVDASDNRSCDGPDSFFLS